MLVTIINLAYQVSIGVIILQIAVSWLITFGVINIENHQAQNLVALLKRATDPVYKPLRKYIPPIGGIDITPLIVILGLNIVYDLLIRAII